MKMYADLSKLAGTNYFHLKYLMSNFDKNI